MFVMEHTDNIVLKHFLDYMALWNKIFVPTVITKTQYSHTFLCCEYQMLTDWLIDSMVRFIDNVYPHICKI